jgi:aspartate aminotransferase/aminotransferase
MYKHLCRLLGGEPVYVDTYPDFQLTAERLEPAGAGRAKLLILNSPNNPTGQVAQEANLREVADWARRNEVFIISDEVYRAFSYDGPCPSVARFTEDVLLLNGFSKSAAMTGWRLGYAVGPAPLVEQMNVLQQFSFVCAPSMAQYGGLAALDVPIDAQVGAYGVKRDIVYEGLRGKFRLQRPTGAFYAFVEAPDGDGDAFCRRAVEKKGLLIIPGSVFSERKTHFRLSFAAPDATLRRGVAALNALA